MLRVNSSAVRHPSMLLPEMVLPFLFVSAGVQSCHDDVPQICNVTTRKRVMMICRPVSSTGRTLTTFTTR